MFIPWPSNSTPKYIPKRNGFIFPHKLRYKNVHSRFLQRSPTQLQTAHRSVRRRTDTYIVIYVCSSELSAGLHGCVYIHNNSASYELIICALDCVSQWQKEMTGLLAKSKSLKIWTKRPSGFFLFLCFQNPFSKLIQLWRDLGICSFQVAQNTNGMAHTPLRQQQDRPGFRISRCCRGTLRTGVNEGSGSSIPDGLKGKTCEL